MNFFSTRMNVIMISTSVVLSIPLASAASPIDSSSSTLLAQAAQTGKLLSVNDIRAQVENRLSSIWNKLPGIATGTAATIDFTINQDGSLSALNVVKSSGNLTFDNAAKGTIKRVVPLPTLPDHLQIKALKLRADFKSSPTKVVSLGFAPLNFGASRRTQPNSTSSNTIRPQNGDNKAKIATPKGFTQPEVSNSTGGRGRDSTKTQNTPVNKTLANREDTKKLVNLGVVAMNAGDYKTAIQKLERAIQINPNYVLAKKNLAIAYNNTGLKLKSKPKEAIKVFHRALYLDPQNARTNTNLKAIITMMGKDPGSFKDRKMLGDIALKEGDKNGARIEFVAALAIKNSAEVRKQLDILDGKFVPITNNLKNKAINSPAKAQNKPKAKPVNPPKKTSRAKKSPAKKPISKSKVNPRPKAASKKAPSSNKLNNVYKRVASLEKKFFGKLFSTDDILTRIGRLEKKSFGNIQSGSPKRRLDALLLAE